MATFPIIAPRPEVVSVLQAYCAEPMHIRSPSGGKKGSDRLTSSGDRLGFPPTDFDSLGGKKSSDGGKVPALNREFCWDGIFLQDGTPSNPADPFEIVVRIFDVCEYDFTASPNDNTPIGFGTGLEYGRDARPAADNTAVFAGYANLGFPLLGPEYYYSGTTQADRGLGDYIRAVRADCDVPEFLPTVFDPNWVTGGRALDVSGFTLPIESANQFGASIFYGYFCHGGFDDSGIYEPIADALNLFYDGCDDLVFPPPAATRAETAAAEEEEDTGY